MASYTMRFKGLKENAPSLYGMIEEEKPSHAERFKETISREEKREARKAYIKGKAKSYGRSFIKAASKPIGRKMKTKGKGYRIAAPRYYSFKNKNPINSTFRDIVFGDW